MRRESKQALKKLAIKRETLRSLQLRVLSDDELRAAAGGRSGCCTMDLCAPSHNRC